MSASKKILGFGNPLLDISAHVEQTTLDEWGATLNNAILAEDKHQPLYAQLVAKHEVDYIAGGATLNSIRVAQWALSALDSPSCTSFVGCIGKDEFGSTMKKQLDHNGVQPLFLEVDPAADPKNKTGTCAVLVKDKERSLIANLAAAELYKIEHFESAEIQEAVSAASIYYMAGFPLTHEGGQATVKSVCKHASENPDKILCMNVSAPFIVQVPPFRAMLLEALKHCTYVFCNESEAEELANAMEWKDATTTEARAQKMSELPSDRADGLIAVVTQGSECTIVAKKGSAPASYPVKKNPWELTQEAIIDSNGAGDAFVGGFISQLALGKEESECVRMGHFAAGTIIQQSGCTCPEYSTVADVLKANK